MLFLCEGAVLKKIAADSLFERWLPYLEVTEPTCCKDCAKLCNSLSGIVYIQINIYMPYKTQIMVASIENSKAPNNTVVFLNLNDRTQ